jgi:hypothetical protein
MTRPTDLTEPHHGKDIFYIHDKAINMNIFNIPKYTVKQQYLGEIHKSTSEKYMCNFMKAKGIESIALELRQDRLCAHVERVVSSEGM